MGLDWKGGLCRRKQMAMLFCMRASFSKRERTFAHFLCIVVHIIVSLGQDIMMLIWSCAVCALDAIICNNNKRRKL